MKEYIKGGIWVLLSFICVSAFAKTNDTQFLKSPVGYWKTIDDVTGKPKSIIRIALAPDHTLVGTVVKIFPAKGIDPHKTCTECTGNNKNKPIVGMMVMQGLKHGHDLWDRGQILDPHNGKTYNCSLRLVDKGQKVDVRGYLGIPLIGRSQTWERVDIMS